jgi:hypothetical protein
MKRRSVIITAVLAAVGLVTLVAYVQGAGPFARPCCTTATVEVQAVHMTNGAASETGCCVAAAPAGGAQACCPGYKDGKCSGDCTACPAMKEGRCPGSAGGCQAISGCQAMPAAGCAGAAVAGTSCQGAVSGKCTGSGVCSATCVGAKASSCSGAASTASPTTGCPGAQASSAKQGKCGGCPFSTK